MDFIVFHAITHYFSAYMTIIGIICMFIVLLDHAAAATNRVGGNSTLQVLRNKEIWQLIVTFANYFMGKEGLHVSGETPNQEKKTFTNNPGLNDDRKVGG